MGKSIELKNWPLILTSENRFKIITKSRGTKFCNEQSKKLYRCYYSSNENSWVFYNTSENLKRIKDIDLRYSQNENLNSQGQEIIRKVKLLQVIKGCSNRTIEVYGSQLKKFIYEFPNRDISRLANEEIIDYIEKEINAGRMSPTAQNQMINAIKFYLEQVLGKPRTFYNPPRPKKKKVLPKIINKEELLKILNEIKNLKHRCMIKLLYSSGLRISELLELKLADIGFDRKQLLIRDSKHGRDRAVMIAETIITELWHYIELYKSDN